MATTAPAHIALDMVPRSPWARRLSADYTVTHGGHEYTAPAGFEFDGASLPRILWMWLGGRFDYGNVHAAAIHDAAYAGQLLRDGARYWCPPALADALWRDVRTALWCEAYPSRAWLHGWRGWLTWAGVRAYYLTLGRTHYMSARAWRIIYGRLKK